MADIYKKIGDVLAAARKEQDKSFEEVSEATRIATKHLEAIENGDPSGVPSEPYFHLFAKSYAQHIGVDPALIAEMAEQPETGTGAVGKRSRSSGGQPNTEEPESSHFGRNLIIFLALATLVFAAILIYGRFFSESPRLTTSSDASHEVDQTTEAADENAVPGDLMAYLDFPSEPYSKPAPLKLALRAKQDVWVVVSRDGDTVLNRQLTAGSTREYEARSRFVLSLGISTAVEISLNDTLLPPLSSQARTITGLEINQVNYQGFMPRPEDTMTTATTAAQREEPSPPQIEHNTTAETPAPAPSAADTIGNTPDGI